MQVLVETRLKNWGWGCYIIGGGGGGFFYTNSIKEEVNSCTYSDLGQNFLFPTNFGGAIPPSKRLALTVVCDLQYQKELIILFL